MNKASNIKTFLIITFILMYLSSIITILLTRFGVFSFSNPLIQVLQFIAGGSPTIAAFFVIYYCYNPPKRERFFSRLFLFKVNFLWWVYAIILPFLILIFRHFIYYRSLNNITFEFNQIIRFLVFLVICIFAGGLEEIGWRGILFDEMKTKFSMVNITIITGVLWAFWHIPLFFIDELTMSDYNFFLYLIEAIIFSGFLTYLILRTKSIALAVVMHAAINASSKLDYKSTIIRGDHSLWSYLSLIVLTLFSLYLVYLYSNKNNFKELPTVKN